MKFNLNYRLLVLSVFVIGIFFVVSKPTRAAACDSIIINGNGQQCSVEISARFVKGDISNPVWYNWKDGSSTHAFTISNTTLTKGEQMNWSGSTTWYKSPDNNNDWTSDSNPSWVGFIPVTGLGGSSGSSGSSPYDNPSGGSCLPGPCANVTATLNSQAANLDYGWYEAYLEIDTSTGTQDTPQYAQIIINVVPPCLISNFSPTASPIDYQTATNLNWTTTNCTTATVVGGNWGSPQGLSPVGGGRISTGNLDNTTSNDYTYTFTMNACNADSTSCAVATTNVVVHAPCVVTLSAIPTVVPYNGTSQLGFSYTGLCSTLNITSSLGTGKYASPGFSEPLNPNPGSDTSDQITTTTIYTLTGHGPNNTSTSTASVSFNNCVINVTSTYNGIQQDPPGGFTYVIEPGDMYGSGQTGSNPWSVVASGQMYTISYLTSPGSVFLSYGTPQSQSCNTIGGAITFNLVFTQQVVTGNGFAYNSLTGSPPPPCDAILLNWTNGSGADENYVRRGGTDLPGSPFPSSTLTYTDTGLDPGQAYHYQLKAANSLSGVQGVWVNFNPTSISPVECVADFSTSDKIITADNGKPINYNSTCIGSGAGGFQTFNNGDTVTFQLNVCNSGQVDANGVFVIDRLGPNLQNPTNFKLNGAPIIPGILGGVISFNLGTIAKKPAGGSATIDKISFDAQIPPSNGSTQTLLTFSNSATITFTTTQYHAGDPTTGCVGTKSTSGCVIKTGNIVFKNGNQNVPNQKEIAP